MIHTLCTVTQNQYIACDTSVIGFVCLELKPEQVLCIKYVPSREVGDSEMLGGLEGRRK
jgi:hypothetical protein